MVRNVLAGVTLLLAGAASILPAAALVGPSNAAPDLASQAVMLLVRNGRTAGFCSAIVVARDALLTAAHCVPSGADIRGYVPGEGAPSLLPAVAVARSPGFRADAIQSRQRSVDLALVRLATVLPDRFRPATLGSLPAHAPGAGFRLAGYGVRQEGLPTSSGTLRAVDVVARAPASDVLLWAEGVSGAPTGACTGDSGGPVLLGESVVAVIAWASGEGGRGCGALTQAVWVAPQRAWIDGVLQGWASR